ncbi:MAG: sigma-70 family RNA polymerase sigma factor [Proteobacteria bacterium]|nr:sigma-70 family RNA polymerase sigma factor [Pseudomonadota bacterium]
MDRKRARFEAEVLPHLDAAYRYALALTRSGADAEDLVQDAVLRAYRHWEGLRQAAKPWLMAIVRNCFFTARARQNRAELVSMSEDEWAQSALQVVAPMADPQTHTIRADQRRRLEQLLAQLAEEHREMLILREIEDLSYREIADIAGLPIGTVMSRLARARQALKELWLHTQGEGAA